MRNFLLHAYRKIVNSIAFLPTIMGILSVIFAFFIIGFEHSDANESIKDKINPALVNDPDSARMILGAIVGGILSLMVFSFTMVMAVLNRATATLSPRVIPGLISKKFHQVVLGFYIGTIIFSLMLMVNVNTSPDNNIEVPSLGILISMASAVGCLALFVYFIHSISEAIQVDSILETISRATEKNITSRLKHDADDSQEQVEVKQWYNIEARSAGYFQHTHTARLIKFLKKEDLILRVNTHRGFYILPGYPYMSVNKALPEHMLTTINNNVDLYIEEYVTEHYTYGFKQMTEIAVKALSPGINDPGTAIIALDMLGYLFSKRMMISEFEECRDRHGKIRLIYHELPFEKLLYNTIAPIREYGKNDTLVIIKILEMLKNLMYCDKDEKHTGILIKEINGVIHDAREGNRNFRDKAAINEAIEAINKISKVTISSI